MGGFRIAVGALPFVLAAAAAEAQTIDHSGGFASTSDMQLNGNAATASSGGLTVLRLTPAVNGQTGSAFSTSQVNVQAFATTFTFQFTPGSNPMADGICFVLQRQGATALGGGGGNLGYQGIPTSVAIAFDIYPNGSFTGIFTNGAAPQAENQTTLTLDFHNGNIFRARLVYDGTTLQVTITDTGSNTSQTQNYTIDIPSTIGGNTAHVGFTGATGGLNAIQDIRTWTFSTRPNAPTNLDAAGGPTCILLTWNASTGAQSYTVYRSTTGAPGSFTALASNVTSTSYSDCTATAGQTYFYLVRAVSLDGQESPDSNIDSASRTASGGGSSVKEHEEGLIDGRCECGSSISAPAVAPPAFLAAVLATALAAFRRRNR
jgi:hypothetical protein